MMITEIEMEGIADQVIKTYREKGFRPAFYEFNLVVRKGLWRVGPSKCCCALAALMDGHPAKSDSLHTEVRRCLGIEMWDFVDAFDGFDRFSEHDPSRLLGKMVRERVLAELGELLA